MALCYMALAAGKEIEALREVREHLPGRHDTRSGGNQFNRQWNAFQALAQFGDSLRIGGCHLKIRTHRLRSIHKKLHGRPLHQAFCTRGIALFAVRNRQRPDRPFTLSWQA
jgi:hypothetical protein